MSLNHLINGKYPQSIIVDNITMPIGSDIDAHNGIFRGDLKVICDNADELKLNPPTKGVLNEFLMSKGDGSVEFKDAGSIGFVTNPLSATLNASNNNIINVNNLATNEIFDQSNLSQIFMNTNNISIFTDELKLNGNEVLTSNTGVKNPMNTDLDANLNNIVNVNQLTTNSIGSTGLTSFIDLNTPQEIAISTTTAYIIADYINLDSATSLTSNSKNILVTPLQEDIDANNQSISNIDIIRANKITSIDESQFINLNTSGEISISAVDKTKINSTDVLLNTIKDLASETSYIAMNPANIELNSASVTINANNVLVTPLQGDIDADSKKIINVDRMTVSSIADSSEQRIIDLSNAGEIQIYATAKTTINSAEVLLNSIKDYDTSTSYIDFATPDEISLFAGSNINIDALTVKINTNDVLTTSNGVSKTMDSTLNANNKNIENANVITVADSIGNTTLSEAFYFNVPNQITIGTNNLTRMTIANASTTFTTPILEGLGTVGAPTYSFSGDTNTGMYSAGADQLGFTTGGTNRMLITTTNIDLTSTNINLNAPTVKINSNNVLTTPLQEDLDANVKDILNANTITTGNIASVDYTRFIDFTAPNIISFTSPSSIWLDTPEILQNTRNKQLVDIHNNNNTYAGLTSKVGSTNCTSYGSFAGSNTSGTNNTAIGYNTMPIASISAIENTALGSNALVALTSARSNTAIGNLALSGITTGNYNTTIGRNSGLGITTGVDNICIGTNNNNTGSSASCSQCIVIGNTAQTSSVNNSIVMGHGTQSTISNECVIGNASCSILRNAGVVCDLGTNNNKFKDLYLSGNIGISGHTITPNGGLYLSTSSGPTITGTGVVNLLNGVSSVGSLAFSSGFPAVSGYRMRFITTLNGVNGDILYLKFLLNAVQILALDVSLSASTNKAGIIELEFYVTTLSATVGVVNMLATYQYDDAGTVKGDTASILYSTLNTTVAQPLTITAAFNTASASNSIQCTRAVLNKIY